MSSVRVIHRNVKEPELGRRVRQSDLRMLETETRFRMAGELPQPRHPAVEIVQDLLRRRQRITHNPIEHDIATCPL
jgi:hypothetical protein